MPTLTDDLHDWLDRSRQRLGALSLDPRLEHIGRVVQVGDGVAMVQGLPETRLDELLIFEGCSHAPIYEKVDEFNQKTLEFLNKHAG